MVRRACCAALLLFCTGCTDDFYVIGSVCVADSCSTGGRSAGGSASAGSAGIAGSSSGAGGSSSGAGGSSPVDGLSLDLTGSGVERLPQQLFGAEPSDFLIADDATPSAWEARVGAGFDVVAPGALALAEPAPFADPGRVLSHSGAMTFETDSAWANTQTGALALEAVFRGEPGALLLSQQDESAGLQLSLDDAGRLEWRLSNGAQQLLVSSQALVADAWHHCLLLFDAAQGAAQIFCNGQAGAATTVPAGFSVAIGAVPAGLGSGSAARLSWAELGRWQGAGWSAKEGWPDVARERFARLVGTYAVGAEEPLPFAEVRASGAYIDMTPTDAPEQRRLHLVGEHWPRIVCRPTAGSARTCGLLVEAASSQQILPEAIRLDQWVAAETSVSAGAAPGPTGASTLYDVVPSMQTAPHTLEVDVPLADGPAVLSLFARAGSGRRLRAEVVGVASASFDLVEPSVVETTGTVAASAESWGEGLLRLSFSFDVAPAMGRLRLTVLDDDSTAVFAGNGSAALQVGDVALSFRSFSTPLPTFGAIQRADHLVYPTGNGNLPDGPWLTFSAEVWLPEAPLLADAAVLNANFASRTDRQINLFVRPQDGQLTFLSRQGDATPWALANPTPLTDGQVHRVTASIGPDGARLSVDGVTATDQAEPYDLSQLDRIEIGTSTNSSGPLTGIVRRLLVAPSE